MNSEKPIADSKEIINRIDRSTYDTDWTVEELRESLNVKGVNPDSALISIKSKLSSIYKFKEQPADEAILNEGKTLNVFPGLIAKAKELGFGVDHLEKITGISKIFILKLDRRLVSLEGRSRSIAALFTDKLKAEVESIWAYLNGISLYPAEGNFKAETMPEIPNKQSFDEAVNTDPLMTEETKAFLLSLHDEK